MPDPTPEDPEAPFEVELTEDSDIGYVVGLVRQAFEYQIDGE